MKYDDASWHYNGEFPSDLPEEAGATHAGMFLAWAILSGLADDELDAEPVTSRSTTPGAYFLQQCDGKLIDEDLNNEGNAFALAYLDLEQGSYFADYESQLGSGLPTLYHVPDTWETYERLKPLLDQRLMEWRAQRG